MSEPTFPFPAGDTAEDDAAPPSRRRTLLALGGLGVVGLGVAGVLVLTGPEEPELGLGLPTGTAAAAATPTPSPSAAVPATAQVRPGRDPFRAPAGAGGSSGGAGAQPAGEELPEPVAAAPAPEDGGALPGSGPSLDGPALDGSPVLDSGPMPGTGPVVDRGSGEQPAGVVQTVRLVRVAGDQTAVLAVDGAVQSVRVGDAFGPGGALLLLSVQQGPDEGQWTAVVQRGSGDPFDVVTGQPATVR